MGRITIRPVSGITMPRPDRLRAFVVAAECTRGREVSTHATMSHAAKRALELRKPELDLLKPGRAGREVSLPARSDHCALKDCTEFRGFTSVALRSDVVQAIDERIATVTPSGLRLHAFALNAATNGAAGVDSHTQPTSRQLCKIRTVDGDAARIGRVAARSRSGRDIMIGVQGAVPACAYSTAAVAAIRPLPESNACISRHDADNRPRRPIRRRCAHGVISRGVQGR